MTDALARVIAEQQKEIDRLRSLELKNSEQWSREIKKRDRVAMAAFSVLAYPDSPECHFELKRAVMDWGYCPACECQVCECEGQYD